MSSFIQAADVNTIVQRPSGMSQSINALSKPQETTDVVVIGAGLAGLAAAHKITAAGYSCIVLEARDRVGGRTWSKNLGSSDTVVDLGAAWINDTNQGRMIALARRFGADLIEQNTTGDCLLQDKDGTLLRFAYGDLPSFDNETKAHLATIRDMVESDCQMVDCAMPKDSELDSLTFAAYLRSRNASERAMSTATVWTRAMLGQEPEDISALFFLNYCKSGGGLMQMRSDQKHGGQYLRVRQGTQLFSHGLAGELPAGTIRLNSPVSAISQPPGQAVVVWTGNGRIAARKVVSAVPQTVLRTITFEPALPASKTLLTDSFHYGYYTKVMVAFTKPFWVERGFCGLVQSFKGPASIIRDTSIPPRNKWVLTCFLAGKPGKEWSKGTEEQKKASLLAQIDEIWGGSQDVLIYFSELLGHEWSTEQYSGYGCPSPALPRGVLDAVGSALRDPFRNVHFAGTETAAEWKGYMEGAVGSGERAGAEIIQGLNSMVSRL